MSSAINKLTENPVKMAVLNPKDLPVLVDVVVPSKNIKEQGQRVRNFVYFDMEVGDVNNPRRSELKRMFCHASELSAEKLPALKQRLIKQVARFATGNSPETYPDLVDQVITVFKNVLQQDIAQIGRIIKKPGSDDIGSVVLKPEVLKAEADIKSALASMVETNGFLLTIPSEHTPQILVTEGENIANVMHESDGRVAQSQGYSLKYSGVDPSPNSDVIYICAKRPCPSLRGAGAKQTLLAKPSGNARSSAVNKSRSDAIADFVFNTEIAMIFSHELVHHFGLDEIGKQHPQIAEAMSEDVVGVEKQKQILNTICESFRGKQVPVVEVIENMKNAGLLPNGAAAEYSELYKSAVDRVFALAGDKAEMKRAEYDSLINSALKGNDIAADKQTKFSRVLKEVATQAYKVCALILVNYHGSQDVYYDQTKQDKSEEIVPTIITCRAGFGVGCTKELLPKSHGVLEQICQDQYKMSLGDKVKYQTQIVPNGV